MAAILHDFASRAERETIDFGAAVGGTIPYEASGHIERSDRRIIAGTTW
jgi:hypothetical protein